MSFELLLVEDDSSIRTVLHDALHTDGHAMTVASDGDEALAILHERRFDLLLLDIMLPGPSGLEILRSVRQQDRDLEPSQQAGPRVLCYDLRGAR